MSSNKSEYEFLDPPEKEGEIGRLGPYRVTGMLGKGGMGQVFRAEDGRLKRSVALKVMNKRFAATANSRKRFVEEARSMAAVHHDNVATIFEVGIKAGTPFMAMEMLKGKTLAAWIAERGQFDVQEVLKLAGEVAAGLSAAHACGIIHRDVKPANIWIEAPSGRAKILDFGLALAGAGVDRFSRRGSVIGTPGYLAPEQARNEPLDDRTDLYSLGVVLYQMSAAKLPLISDSVPGQLIKIISHQPKPLRDLNPDVPQPLADLIHQLLAKEPRDRPRSASELEQQVLAVADLCRSESQVALQIVTASPTTPAKKSTPPSATASSIKRWLPWVLSAASLIATVAVVWQFVKPKRVATKVATKVERVTAGTEQKPVFVSAASLKPLGLTPITAGSSRVASGDAARFQMRIENVALDADSDPRRINARAKVAAQVVTYLKSQGGLKRKAPPFPQKYPPSQLPAPGESKQVEILFITGSLLPGEFEVIFELQSPSGALISSTTTTLTVTENLGAGDLLGFEWLRTHAGGADTYVRTKTDDDFGSKSYLSAHRKGNGDAMIQEHIYLKFDLSKSPVPKNEIDRAVLLLTVEKGGHQANSTINVYGVNNGLPDDWVESGQSHLTWDQAPSRSGVESLRYLCQVTMDNGRDTLKDVVDGVRIYGTNLDDFLRTASGDIVTLVLIRENRAEKPTWFKSKEGKPKQAPALALRRR